MTSDCGCSSRFNEDGEIVIGLHEQCEKHGKELLNKIEEESCKHEGAYLNAGICPTCPEILPGDAWI